MLGFRLGQKRKRIPVVNEFTLMLLGQPLSLTLQGCQGVRELGIPTLLSPGNQELVS